MAMTVTLLLVMITGLRAGWFFTSKSDNTPDLHVYSDICKYGSDFQTKCGDRCISEDGNCGCGNDTFNPLETKEQCCIPSDETCSPASSLLDSKPVEAVCRKSVKIPISSQCNNSNRSLQCYNSYQDSQEIGYYRTYFTCPDTCVSLKEEMCQGVSWCSSDVQECGPQLRCRESDGEIISLDGLGG